MKNINSNIQNTDLYRLIHCGCLVKIEELPPTKIRPISLYTIILKQGYCFIDHSDTLLSRELKVRKHQRLYQRAFFKSGIN